MLFHVASKALEKANWPTRVLPGSRAFVPGDNNRYVAEVIHHKL